MKKVLICGASIAGPTLAYWLARAGFAVTLVERAPRVREGGYAIDIRGAALTVAARMGILERLREAGTDTVSNAFIDERGSPFVTFDRGFGVLSPEDIEIMRGDVSRILHELTADTVEYLFGDTIQALEPAGDTVRVTFQHAEPSTFDFVVGADGIHSRVRELALGPEESCVRCLGGYIAIFTGRNHAALDRAQWMYMGPGKVVSIKSDRGNATVKATFLFSSRSVDCSAMSAPEQRQAVATVFADLGGPIPALLGDLGEAPDFYFDATNQIRLPAWSKGRVALVGDAAHAASPMTGQGTSLALIGAYVLARELAADPSPAALVRYESTLRAFVEKNQDVAVKTAKGFAPATRFGAWFRNINMRILPHLPWRDFVLDLMMADIKAAASGFSLEPERASPLR